MKTTIGNGTVSSFLYLATATANDSGIYSCQLPNLAEAKLSLHILNGVYIQLTTAKFLNYGSKEIFFTHRKWGKSRGLLPEGESLKNEVQEQQRQEVKKLEWKRK